MNIELQKLIVFEKLQATGIRSRKEFLQMSTVDMIYSIPEIEPAELQTLRELQDSVRDGNLFEYLCQKGDVAE